MVTTRKINDYDEKEVVTIEGGIALPRHFSEEEKNVIRDQLIQVGLELFEKYGIDKTSIGDITDKVGIAKGSFYAFFNSKGDLFMEIYSVERKKVHKRMIEKFKGRTDSIEKLLEDYISELRKALKERPILDIVYNSNALMLISDKSVRERLLAYNNVINTQTAELIQSWMDRQGKFSVNARVITEMIRSINFLKFHDYAIGLDIFDTVIDTMTEAVAQFVKNARIAD